VINSSYPTYNLATHKMLVKFKREGHEVMFSPRADMMAMQADKAYLSVIFTYDLPKLYQDANLLRQNGVELEIGGPAATALPQYIVENTGVTPHLGLDERFEHVPGNKFFATFTSRGCPRNCEFCLVPRLEGRKMIEYDDFSIPVGKNPYVCDNNILATSWAHQQLVVEKLKHVKNLDLNSGFDDRIFMKDPEKYWRLYSQLHLEAWRFAYDTPAQREAIKETAEFLHGKGVDYRRIIVFCLIGFPGTKFSEAVEKIEYLIGLGTSPYPMRYRPLDALERNFTPPGWAEGEIEKLFAWAGVPFVWRSCSWEDFKWKGELSKRKLWV